MERDTTPRYAPSETLIIVHGKARILPVIRYRMFPPGTHPDGCPLISDCTALELVTDAGSSWWGVERAWINSELRAVVAGFPSTNELIACVGSCAE